MKKLHLLAEEFYEYLRYSKSPRTAYNYALNVDSFLRFVKKPLERITPLDITRWYRHLTKKDYDERSLVRFGWALKAFFDVMGRDDLKKRTPIPRYNPEYNPPWLDEKTTFKLIDSNPVLCVAYDLALRAGEVPLLKLSDYNPQTGNIIVYRLKHHGRRNEYPLRLDDWCRKILNEYLENVAGSLNDSRIFPFSVATIQRQFKRRAKIIGLDTKKYKFHCLRHSRITHIAIHELEKKGNVDIVSLAQFAGHLRVETTMMYIHLASRYLAFKSRSESG